MPQWISCNLIVGKFPIDCGFNFEFLMTIVIYFHERMNVSLYKKFIRSIFYPMNLFEILIIESALELNLSYDIYLRI